MSCDKIQDQLMDYLDQDLDGEKNAFIRRHLDRCVTCTERLNEIRKLRALVSKKTVSPDASFFEGMRRDLFEKIRKNRPSKEIVFEPGFSRKWIPVLVPVTVALVLFIGIRVISPRYEEYAMKRDLTELALIQEDEKPGSVTVSSSENDALEEELALTKEQPLILAEAEDAESPDAWIRDEVELLNALGEGDTLDENGNSNIEELEEEMASFEEGAVG